MKGFPRAQVLEPLGPTHPTPHPLPGLALRHNASGAALSFLGRKAAGSSSFRATATQPAGGSLVLSTMA